VVGEVRLIKTGVAKVYDEKLCLDFQQIVEFDLFE
jgi:hypothetical protein